MGVSGPKLQFVASQGLIKAAAETRLTSSEEKIEWNMRVLG